MKNLQKTFNHEFDEPNKPLFETRNYLGYYQYLVTCELNDKPIYNWSFYITGFGSSGTTASILKWDQTHEVIPIDEEGKILVNGKPYSTDYWNH